ncbi:protein MKS1-like [Silene latifolia]|uniref:protein MKS1-like n=1 Tax=Silene latifolia TaxID=37657 RepID=UPI003D787324
MDCHPFDDSIQGGRPPRKELQGPRPAPLKVRKESHKIKKPPVVPPGTMPSQQMPPPQQPRQPVIIYTVSPKVIHANPNEFMPLVQRLTGPDHATSSSTSHHRVFSGVIAPVARFGSIEMAKMPFDGSIRSDVLEGQDVEAVERRVFLPSVLSPGPNSFPPISPDFFSPFFRDQTRNYNNSNSNNHTNMNVNHEISNYVEGSSNNYIGNNPFSSSNNFTSPGAVISPNSLEFLHHILNT